MPAPSAPPGPASAARGAHSRRCSYRLAVGALGAALGAGVACERAAPDRPADSPVASVAVPPDTAPPPEPPRSMWLDEAGPALLAAGPSPETALVIYSAADDTLRADSARRAAPPLAGAVFDLLGRSGLLGTATLGRARSADDECDAPAVAPLRAAAGVPAGWLVAFPRGVASPVSLDSIETLAPKDSARLAADVARLASALPGDTAPDFRGIPFRVRTARRFRVEGTEVIVADVVRSLAQEANPRQEHILLVAERDTAAPAGVRHEAAYVERSAGPEETVASSDPLAAVQLGTPPRPFLVLRRDDAGGGAYVLLERTGPRRWRVRWLSPYVLC
ncbi:MAG TPA: hypothetical protein VNA89_05595 [Gemmatimonadaceae bacterium]|nr:hypothetical protein [Gemmatimonadaceae bacterium]